jgi:osomolarity two-component system sensor histidine kinase TcsA
MHGMLSALTLLTDTPLAREQRELGGIIEESGKVLLEVINNVLDYSKLASGIFSVNSDIISIPDIVTSVVRGSQTRHNPGVSLDASLDPNLPKSVYGDPLRYRQIIQNLVSNAVKFTKSRSIRVRASGTEDVISYIILQKL